MVFDLIVALRDVSALLASASSDPLADIRAALTAEVTGAASELGAKELLAAAANLRARFSELASFPRLAAAAAGAGFAVVALSTHGFTPNAKYQKMLDGRAAEAGEWRRRQAKLEQDAKLEESRLELAKRRATEEREKQAYELELLAAKSEAELKMAEQKNNQTLEFLEALHKRGG